MSEPKVKYLKDYKPSSFIATNIYLDFKIENSYTIVTSKTTYKINNNENYRTLILDGEKLEIISVKLNNSEIDTYKRTENSLILENCPDEFSLEITTQTYPDKNTSLEGLYKSNDTYCTQCEAEGFRKITYFLDRPDVMVIYKVRIQADIDKYPLLLSNGNLIDQGYAPDNKHFTIWEDPFPKPCYLFALVAGDLVKIEDNFTTKSGKLVKLRIYVRSGDENQCDHAMLSLKNSMKWDEEKYGREYDLNLYNIVAVSDFNMGAMENKSLNIFNTALVLAHKETATDTDFIRVESVIGHEYFHNWTGNRITCRDWFQLSLKEGLTVFRDQEFSSDLNSRTVQRIDDVQHLRKMQFQEDASPLSHPVRPDNYIEINNFYTMTIYEKGAEVIRMMHTILGKHNFRKGTDLYFDRHDGQAVTCEDFIKCMEDASQHDLTQFKLWYTQAGTPEIDVKTEYDTNVGELKITLSQKIPTNIDAKLMHIPVKMALFSDSGKKLELNRNMDKEQILELKEQHQTYTFNNIPNDYNLSILRDFSAPVILKNADNDKSLTFLMKFDDDGFNKFESSQKLAINAVKTVIQSPSNNIDDYIMCFRHLAESALMSSDDKALTARLLSFPDLSTLILHFENADPDIINKKREEIIYTLATKCHDLFQGIYDNNNIINNSDDFGTASAQRALKNIALSYLVKTGKEFSYDTAKRQYQRSDNMTDRIAALSSLSHTASEQKEFCLSDFAERFKDHELAMDKWFAIQASSQTEDCLNNLESLVKSEKFNINNPNRVRSVYASFAMNNPLIFHKNTGDGYNFVIKAIKHLNSINPQIGSRLLTSFRSWNNFTSDRQELMKKCLHEILAIENLSKDIYEIASKSLNS